MEKTKKTPQRMCIACRTMHDKSELVRFVKSADGAINLDATGKLAGRGAYICNNLTCANKAVKTKALNRAFKCNVDSTVLEKIKEHFGE